MKQSSEVVLNATELALLSHYLTHTSRAIAFDKNDLDALQVGIPDLAFHSQPLMASLLALAAACKSHDVVKHAARLDCQHLDEVRDPLALAGRYHRDSLREIQAAIQTTDRYDYILANAALMVLYGSASHCVRTAR